MPGAPGSERPAASTPPTLPAVERNFVTTDRASGYRTASVLAIPLRDKSSKVVGVMQVLNKRGGQFSGDDEQLVTAIAAQAAVALDNARLYEAIVKKNLELTEAQVALRHK